MRKDQMASVLATEMYGMLALVDGVRIASRQFRPKRVRSRNIETDRLALFVLKTHEPDPDFELDDFASRNGFVSVVGMEWVVRVDRLARIDVTVRSSETTDGSVIDDETI